MNLALVKLESDGESYLFEVSKELYHDLCMNMGVRVLCETADGRKIGKLTGFIKSADMVDTSYPICEIVAVEHEVPIERIEIPTKFKRTPPKDDKIVKRFWEYYHHKCFLTNISLSDDGMLTDGYSAYLVAKAMGFPVLKMFCYK